MEAGITQTQFDAEYLWIMKQTIKTISCIFLTSVIFTACMSSKKLKESNPYPLSLFSASTVNGLYANKIESRDYDTFGLWNMLIRSQKNKNDTVQVNNEMQVELHLIDSTTLEVKLIENQKKLSEFTLQGEIVDQQYFSVKRKYFLFPSPLYFRREETKNMIANGEDGSLILIHGYKKASAFLNMGNSYGGIDSFKFEKIK